MDLWRGIDKAEPLSATRSRLQRTDPVQKILTIRVVYITMIDEKMLIDSFKILVDCETD